MIQLRHFWVLISWWVSCQKRWITLSANFRWKGTSPTNLCWYKKTRVITPSGGIKISAVCSLVSSQSTRVADRRTDRITIIKIAPAWLLRAVKSKQAVFKVMLSYGIGPERSGGMLSSRKSAGMPNRPIPSHVEPRLWQNKEYTADSTWNG